MLFKECVCVNLASASEDFFDPLRDVRKKQYIELILAEQTLALSVTVSCRLAGWKLLVTKSDFLVNSALHGKDGKCI
jgi:hypothetical protein